MREMTARQREVLEFIRAFGDQHGVPPTVREIAEKFRFTARAAFDHLRALERKGMLERRVTGKRASRTLVLPTQKGGRRAEPPAGIPPGIPVLGRIAAGTPITAVENQEDTIPLRPEWLGTGGQDVFALRVRGDSMTAPHGNSRTYPAGCVIFVDPEKRSPTNGERVIAKLHGADEVTFKVYKEEDGRKWLQPLNPTHQPIRDEFAVLGTVIGKWEDE